LLERSSESKHTYASPSKGSRARVRKTPSTPRSRLIYTFPGRRELVFHQFPDQTRVLGRESKYG
ncbi:unnamed protein product, partial [Ilex paraguariensis]